MPQSTTPEREFAEDLAQIPDGKAGQCEEARAPRRILDEKRKCLQGNGLRHVLGELLLGCRRLRHRRPLVDNR